MKKWWQKRAVWAAVGGFIGGMALGGPVGAMIGTFAAPMAYAVGKRIWKRIANWNSARKESNVSNTPSMHNNEGRIERDTMEPQREVSSPDLVSYNYSPSPQTVMQQRDTAPYNSSVLHPAYAPSSIPQPMHGNSTHPSVQSTQSAATPLVGAPTTSHAPPSIPPKDEKFRRMQGNLISQYKKGEVNLSIPSLPPKKGGNNLGR